MIMVLSKRRLGKWQIAPCRLKEKNFNGDVLESKNWNTKSLIFLEDFSKKTSLGVTVQGSDFFQEHTTLNQFYCPIKLSKTDKVELLFKLKLPRKNPTGKFHDHTFGL